MPGWHSADESVSELLDGAFHRLPEQKKSSDLDGAGETDIRFGGFTQGKWADKACSIDKARSPKLGRPRFSSI